jgi:ribosomal subunit interface protein
MLKKFEITGVHTEISDNLRKYVTKKLGKIDKYLSKQARPSAHLEVFLKESKEGGKKLYTCNAILHLPHDTIKVSESTINMFAAVADCSIVLNGSTCCLAVNRSTSAGRLGPKKPCLSEKCKKTTRILHRKTLQYLG